MIVKTEPIGLTILFVTARFPPRVIGAVFTVTFEYWRMAVPLMTTSYVPPGYIVKGAFMKPSNPIVSSRKPPLLMTIGVAMAAGVERFRWAVPPTVVGPM